MHLTKCVGKGNISAKLITDSVSTQGIRLSTMQLHYPRFIHAEFMTHRMFSRNASSSRAIPVEKMLNQVKAVPAMPIHWGKNKSGMQADEECNTLIDEFYDDVTRETAWRNAAYDARGWAAGFAMAGYHKQIVNRLTEPFQFIRVIVTATEWDNFFNLRLHKDAQPEIQELARCMKTVLMDNTPSPLDIEDYHLPYITHEDVSLSIQEKIECSVARCARVSYLNHDQSSPNHIKDFKLFKQLKDSEHMSPFEHVAVPMADARFRYDDDVSMVETGVTHVDVNADMWSGNFRGWIQYRQLLDV